MESTTVAAEAGRLAVLQLTTNEPVARKLEEAVGEVRVMAAPCGGDTPKGAESDVTVVAPLLASRRMKYVAPRDVGRVPETVHDTEPGLAMPDAMMVRREGLMRFSRLTVVMGAEPDVKAAVKVSGNTVPCGATLARVEVSCTVPTRGGTVNALVVIDVGAPPMPTGADTVSAKPAELVVLIREPIEEGSVKMAEPESVIKYWPTRGGAMGPGLMRGLTSAKATGVDELKPTYVHETTNAGTLPPAASRASEVTAEPSKLERVAEVKKAAGPRSVKVELAETTELELATTTTLTTMLPRPLSTEAGRATVTDETLAG